MISVHYLRPFPDHEAVVSIQLENTVDEMMRTIHAHPSLAEAVGQANEDVKGLAIDKG